LYLYEPGSHCAQSPVFSKGASPSAHLVCQYGGGVSGGGGSEGGGGEGGGGEGGGEGIGEGGAEGGGEGGGGEGGGVGGGEGGGGDGGGGRGATTISVESRGVVTCSTTAEENQLGPPVPPFISAGVFASISLAAAVAEA
jgi:hypothetical protein